LNRSCIELTCVAKTKINNNNNNNNNNNDDKQLSSAIGADPYHFHRLTEIGQIFQNMIKKKKKDREKGR